MVTAHRVSLPGLLILAAVTAAGCGTGLLHHASPTSTHRAAGPGVPAQPRGGPPSGGPGGHGASAGAVKVVQAWSDALRRGDVHAAARYFRIPSVFADGPGSVTVIHNLAQAEAVNESLPCGAKFVSAAQRGPFISVLFRLTARPGAGGGSCGSGAGQTARTNFLIRNGRIAEWIRAPTGPGGNGSAATATGPVI
jgi:hypothetical protein